MVKQRRVKRNRKNSLPIKRELALLRTGIPVSRRNVSRDPPMLPHVLAYPVRVRFGVNMYNTTNTQGYSVNLGGTPTAPNSITINANLMGSGLSNQTSTVGLSFNQVFVAAAMRLFGVDVSVDPSGANYVTTDYAIMKVTAYGPDQTSFSSPSIGLSVDVGGDVPGFSGRDSSSKNGRAVVSFSVPRLSWQKIESSSVFNFLSYTFSTSVALPNNLQSNVYIPLGVIDLTVMVRRSVLTQSNASAAIATNFIDDAGNLITTTPRP